MRPDLEFYISKAGKVVMSVGNEVFPMNSAHEARTIAKALLVKADEIDPGGHPAAVLTCVYCGQAYATGIPSANHKALYEHILQCEKHPLPRLLKAAKEVLAGLNKRIGDAPRHAVPVFDGIAELHSAIAAAEAPR